MAYEAEMMRSMEQDKEVKVYFVGRLGDLGLGNPDGIPSSFADASSAEVVAEAERITREAMVRPTDLTTLSCIDGRPRLGNVDGSAKEVRLRRVGGSASNFGVALNAGASVVETLPKGASLGDQVAIIDDHVTAATGYEKSAHEGGCGGANGEVADNEAIANNPAILAATKKFMEIPAVRSYLEVGYDDVLGSQVGVNAAKTAAYLRENGWDGQSYVDSVAQDNPSGVEKLEVNPDDHKFHGHKERQLLAVLGDETIEGDDFVWNLKASKEVAQSLAGQRGAKGYQQALIAEVAKHMAVAYRLPSNKTPVVLIDAARS